MELDPIVVKLSADVNDFFKGMDAAGKKAEETARKIQAELNKKPVDSFGGAFGPPRKPGGVSEAHRMGLENADAEHMLHMIRLNRVIQDNAKEIETRKKSAEKVKSEKKAIQVAKDEQSDIIYHQSKAKAAKRAADKASAKTQRNQTLLSKARQGAKTKAQKRIGLGRAAALGAAFQVGRSAIFGITDSLQDVIGLTERAVGWAWKLGLQYEQDMAAFEVMAGSASKGKALYTSLEDLAIKSPYDVGHLATSARIVMGMGVAVDQVTPVIGRLGDIAMGSSFRLQHLALVYGQVMAANRFHAQDAMQFAQMGIGSEDFAKTMGITVGRYRAKMRADLVGPEVVQDTMNRLTKTGGRFAGGSKKINETVGGQLNTLVETAERYGRRFAEAFFQRFHIAENIGDLAAGIGPLMEKWTDPILNGLERAKHIGFEVFEMLKAGWRTAASQLSVFGVNLANIDAAFGSTESIVRDVFDTLLMGVASGIDMMKQFTVQIQLTLSAARALVVPLGAIRRYQNDGLEQARVDRKEEDAAKFKQYHEDAKKRGFWDNLREYEKIKGEISDKPSVTQANRNRIDKETQNQIKAIDAAKESIDKFVNSPSARVEMRKQLDASYQKIDKDRAAQAVVTSERKQFQADSGVMGVMGAVMAQNSRQSPGFFGQLAKDNVAAIGTEKRAGFGGTAGGLGMAMQDIGLGQEAIVPEIEKTLKISSEAANATGELEKAMRHGISPLEKFTYKTKLLIEAFEGNPLDKTGTSAELSKNMLKQGLVEDYKELVKSIPAPVYASAAYKGSVEAQDAINKSADKSLSLEENMDKNLDAIARQQAIGNEIHRRMENKLFQMYEDKTLPFSSRNTN